MTFFTEGIGGGSDNKKYDDLIVSETGILFEV